MFCSYFAGSDGQLLRLRLDQLDPDRSLADFDPKRRRVNSGRGSVDGHHRASVADVALVDAGVVGFESREAKGVVWPGGRLEGNPVAIDQRRLGWKENFYTFRRHEKSPNEKSPNQKSPNQTSPNQTSPNQKSPKYYK